MKSRISFYPPISISLFLKKKSGNNIASILNGVNIYLFSSGRVAINHAIRLINPSPKDNILLPEYNCGVEISAISDHIQKIKYYRINEDFSIDIHDLCEKIDEYTKAIFLIHYFGFPVKEVKKIREICDDKKIYLIEDCAHSPFSRYQGQLLGSFGHLCIFSFWKILPVPDGGALKINDFKYKPEYKTNSSNNLHIYRLFISSVIHRTHRDYCPYYNKNDKNKSEEEKYFNLGNINSDISSISIRIMSTLDVNDIVKKRRDNYLHLLNRIKMINYVKPVFQYLPDGVCPLLFPILVPAEIRKELYNKLLKDGIETVIWWGFTHPDFPINDFPYSKYLKESILALPIHQGLNFNDIDRLVTRLKYHTLT